MFEAAEVGNKLSKDKYKSLEAKLRVELLKAQHQLAASPLSLVVLVGGVEGAGRGEFVNLVLTWLDARGVEVHAYDEPTDEERERPFFWRYWRLLPSAGRTALMFGSWYTKPIVDRAFKLLGSGDFERHLDRVVEFERMLARENVVLVKLWFHVTKKEQKRRFKALEKDPDNAWRVTKADWDFHKRYDRFRDICEHALIKTSTAEAPWQVIEGTDRRYRDATAAQAILVALQSRLSSNKSSPKKELVPDRPKPKAQNVLSRLDLSRKLSDKEFDERLAHYQARVALLARKLRKKGRSLILGFEGPDAAGKGGAIRRISSALDAKLYTVRSISAPTDEERSHPYLWRFWRGLPRQGRVTIYDRTWYGRVLVERIEGFAAPDEWKRAFSEINSFEEQLHDYGTIMLKFWIEISPEEELRRFKDRQVTPYKQYKLTEEDWRNREKWDAYQAAACEMIERTSTAHAPWILVEGEDKNWARVKILKTVAERLESEL